MSGHIYIIDLTHEEQKLEELRHLLFEEMERLYTVSADGVLVKKASRASTTTSPTSSQQLQSNPLMP